MPTHSRTSASSVARWAGVKVDGAHAFGRDCLAVGAGAENQIADLVAENGLLLLLVR